MNRFLAGALIVGAVLAMNGLFAPDAMAGEAALPSGPATGVAANPGNRATVVPPNRIMALLLALETLRSAAANDSSKG
jgi:hypothetical protein